jgi:hypothetical protein
MAILMDYAALERQHPKAFGESEQGWRTRLTSDGLARFTTKGVMRNLVHYRELMANADAAHCPVVIVPDEAPTFADKSYSTEQSLEAMAAGMVARDAGEPRTITAHQARDVRFLQQQRTLAKQEGREFVVTGEEDPVTEYDNVVNIPPDVRKDPVRLASAMQQAAREGKQVRLVPPRMF